jgi:hypothetical protein
MDRLSLLRELAVALIVAISLVACGSARFVDGTDRCMTDSECVAATCCHAMTCVGTVHAPSCNDAVCSTECRPGTIDCGGRCFCHDGVCAAIIVR